MSNYEDMTNEELQEELRSRDLKVSGNKDELVQRLEEDDSSGGSDGSDSDGSDTAASDGTEDTEDKETVTTEDGEEVVDPIAEAEGDPLNNKNTSEDSIRIEREAVGVPTTDLDDEAGAQAPAREGVGDQTNPNPTETKQAKATDSKEEQIRKDPSKEEGWTSQRLRPRIGEDEAEDSEAKALDEE